MLAMEGGGDMLSLLTGVGGALSALGRDMPVDRERNQFCPVTPAGSE